MGSDEYSNGNGNGNGVVTGYEQKGDDNGTGNGVVIGYEQKGDDDGNGSNQEHHRMVIKVIANGDPNGQNTDPNDGGDEDSGESGTDDDDPGIMADIITAMDSGSDDDECEYAEAQKYQLIQRTMIMKHKLMIMNQRRNINE